VTGFDDPTDGDVTTGPEQGGGVVVHLRQDREQGVRSWLLLSAPSGMDTARSEWQQGGIALLRCGALFGAVRMDTALVHAAAGSDDPDIAARFLAEVLHGGPVFVDRHRACYYALVPPSAGNRREWRDQRYTPFAEFLGLGSYVGVPRPSFTRPDDHFSYWVVPMDGPGDLCPVEALSHLVNHGRDLLATAEAHDGR
jgi:hypothetical protein